MLILLACSIYTINAQTPQPPQPPLEDYVGKYVFPDGSPVPDVDVVLSSGTLMMNSAAGNSSLVQLGIDSFSIVEFSGTAVFRRGDDKKVQMVHIEAMGYILDGNKMPGGIWIFSVSYSKETRDKRQETNKSQAPNNKSQYHPSDLIISKILEDTGY